MQLETPRIKFVKLNSDAQFDVSTGIGFCGVVCRDDKGKLITGLTSRIYANSTLVAEALVHREAAHLNLSNVVVESDCQDLIEVCRGNRMRREIHHIIEDIKNMRNKFT